MIMAWKWNATNNGWILKIENSHIETEQKELAYAKHLLLSFGRANSDIVPIPEKQQGYIGEVLSGRQMYSTAWVYYLEGRLTFTNIKKLIGSFNKAARRDYNAGLIDLPVIVTKVVKLQDGSLSVDISIGSKQNANIVINI